MASFTGVGDNTTLTLSKRGEVAAIALSGTYNMTIALQREQGSPGSGTWETLKTWTTADATVAYQHSAANDNERLRLIVLVDNSGTCTATLTDSTDYAFQEFKDQRGNTLLKLTETGIEIGGSIRRRLLGAVGPMYTIAAAMSVNAEEHAGRIGLFDIAAGVTVTLPAATGTGNQYTFFVKTTVTSVADKIAALGTDIIQGGVAVSTDAGGVAILAGATADYLSMNGSTTGGLIGSWVRLTDVASGIWMCEGFLVSTGAEATPFGAT